MPMREITLDKFLKREMQNRHLSIAGLARISGIPRQSLYGFLDGARPNIENCRRLAFFLDLSLGTIVEMAYPDVEGKLIDALVSTYLSLTEEGRHVAEDMLFSVQRRLGESNV
ncbi:MAG: helix-turn-helix transcriptional regulator [Ktedonobacteraceae bacterium]